MNTYIVCRSKKNDRLALIPKAEIESKEWSQTEQAIAAETWMDARNHVNEDNMYEYNESWYDR